MGRSLVGKRHLAALLAVVAPALLGATSLANNFEQRVLAAHNFERNEVGVPPLNWDPRLAASAQSWANRLAATGSFHHTPASALGEQGENLWMGTSGYFSIDAMVEGWLREKRYFKPGRFPDNSTTGDYRDVGHYTQLIWHDTGSVGCAEASNGENDYLVCRYSQAGNYIGEKPF